ncbi:MAG: AAA family ATPase [Anaerolineales bacterium]|nr:AAA family ATPase [Anaerolineales bacterium]
MMDAILPFVESTTKVLLHGPFGAGKTTLALARINWLLRRERVRGDDILVLTPQRTLAEPYRQALLGGELPTAGPPVVMTTFASLAQQAVERYWPLIAGDAGFNEPSREPNFLTLETSQYHMARLVDQAIDEGAFDALRLERNRVVSQVLDNLNKAALLRMDIDTVYRRLELAAPFSEQRAARLNALRAAQRLSHAFRALCLTENLLDFSLQVEVFNRQVLHHPWSRTHLFRSHRHIIFDNAEEDTPSAHRLVLEWLPQLASGLIIVDDGAGYRSFLGADPRRRRISRRVRRTHPSQPLLGDAGRNQTTCAPDGMAPVKAETAPRRWAR